MKPKCTFSVLNRGGKISHYLDIAILLEYTIDKVTKSLAIELSSIIRKENGDFNETLYKDPFFYYLLKPYYKYVVEEPESDYYDTLFFSTKEDMEGWIKHSKKDETCFKVRTIEEFFNIKEKENNE